MEAEGPGSVQRRSRAGERTRRILFVINNWTEEEYLDLSVDLPNFCKWLILAKEVGDQGTPHIQGLYISSSAY